MSLFDYDRAFERNRGLVSVEEQRRLRRSRVAIVGAGGVGGVHALTLARMGVGHLRLIDPDTFDLVNFNRQAGASLTTLGRAKASCMAEAVRQINPEAELEVYDVALDARNVDALLDGVDLVLDGIDFFGIDARITTYGYCREHAIPVIISGPIGMSATMQVFAPGSMSFDRYFDLRPGMSRLDQIICFLAGLTPRMLQRPYMDVRFSNVKEQYGPSLAPAVMLCAGVAGVEALRCLLRRPGLRCAPHYYQFDAYRQRMSRGVLWLGNRNPLQRIKRFILRRLLLKRVSGAEELASLPLADHGASLGLGPSKAQDRCERGSRALSGARPHVQ